MGASATSCLYFLLFDDMFLNACRLWRYLLHKYSIKVFFNTFKFLTLLEQKFQPHLYECVYMCMNFIIYFQLMFSTGRLLNQGFIETMYFRFIFYDKIELTYPRFILWNASRMINDTQAYRLSKSSYVRKKKSFSFIFFILLLLLR